VILRSLSHYPCSGLAEILMLAWVFGAIVIGEVRFNILWQIPLGFYYPPARCTEPSCKLSTFVE
jgi:hypothetical protein